MLAKPDDGDVLIFSSLGEPCTQWVTRELEKSGCEYRLVNFEEALLNNVWSIEINDASDAATYISRLTDDGYRDSDKPRRPRSVWMRRWGHPIYPAAFDELSVAFSFGEITSVVSALPEVLTRARWVNDQRSERRATNKVFQLTLARSLGFEIPRTLVTSDPDRVRAFAATVPRVIFKPVSGYHPNIRTFNGAAHSKLEPNADGIDLGYGRKSGGYLVFTQELTPERMDLLETVRWAPAIFQERISKRSDIRVTIVGHRIFACRILSQSRSDTETDFRMMNLSGVLRHEEMKLPDLVERRVRSLMSALGLTFGCMDLIETEDGGYCFLEVNPAGQWLWIEQLTGAPISRAIADELIEGSEIATRSTLVEPASS